MAKYDPRRYRLEEENSHRFYQMPKELFTNPKYKELDSNAKILYSVLLDRKELSRKNKWVDKYNQVYLIYTRENIADLLNVSIRTVTKVFNQLRDAKLIEEEQQGLNKPNKIYVLRLEYQGQAKVSSQDRQKLLTSDTDLRETEFKDLKDNNIGDESPMIFSLYNKLNLNQILEEFPVHVITAYAHIYKDVLGKKHPNLKIEQLQNIEENLFDINSTYGLDEDDWENLIWDYFENESIGDGNINRFFHGDAYQGVIRGILN